MAGNENGKGPDLRATVYLKEPLKLPDGTEITEALFGGYKIVQNALPVQVPTQVMKGLQIVTEMKQGMAMLNMPVGLIALLIPIEGEHIEISVPMSDVRLLINIADYDKLAKRTEAPGVEI